MRAQQQQQQQQQHKAVAAEVFKPSWPVWTLHT
jgi:hypothetical protein